MNQKKWKMTRRAFALLGYKNVTKRQFKYITNLKSKRISLEKETRNSIKGGYRSITQVALEQCGSEKEK